MHSFRRPLVPAVCPVNTVHSPKFNVFKNHFTNNLPPTRGSSKWALSGRFPTNSLYAFLLSPLCSIRHTERIC